MGELEIIKKAIEMLDVRTRGLKQTSVFDAAKEAIEKDEREAHKPGRDRNG